jgi:Family of unknown function (DUF6153)
MVASRRAARSPGARVSSPRDANQVQSALGMPVVFGNLGRVIRWHGSSRHRSNAVSRRVLASWSGRLALLAIALGLVLMHHVVGAHQHASPGPPQGGPVAHLMAEHGAAPTIAHHDHSPAPGPKAAVGSEQARGPGPQVSTVVQSSAAVLHPHPDGSGHNHSGSLLHMCLVALLGAAILLLVLVLLASWWRLPQRGNAERGRTAAAEPRAPPTSSRLAELQLLRL